MNKSARRANKNCDLSDTYSRASNQNSDDADRNVRGAMAMSDFAGAMRTLEKALAGACYRLLVIC